MTRHPASRRRDEAAGEPPTTAAEESAARPRATERARGSAPTRAGRSIETEGMFSGALNTGIHTDGLRPDVRARISTGLGEDLSGVEVRRGVSSSDAAHGVRAVAERERVAVDGATLDRQGTPEGLTVLGEELAHVVQKRRGTVVRDDVDARGASVGAWSADREGLEREARTAGALIAAGGSASIAGGARAPERQFSLWDYARRAYHGVQNGVGAVEHAVAGGIHQASDAIDHGAHALAAGVQNVPVLGTVARGAADVVGAGAHVVGNQAEATTHAIAHPIATAEAASNTVTRGVTAAEHGVTNAMHRAEDFVDHGSHALARRVAGVPVLGSVARGAADAATSYAHFEGGLVQGATGMVGGLVNAAAHPLQTAHGIEQMVEHGGVPIVSTALRAGHDVIDGRGAGDIARRALVPGATAREDGAFWQRVGHGIAEPYRNSRSVAEGVGRATFDIGSMFVGGGEAGAAGRVAHAASAIEHAAPVVNAIEHAAPAVHAASAVEHAAPAVHAASAVEHAAPAVRGAAGATEHVTPAVTAAAGTAEHVTPAVAASAAEHVTPAVAANAAEHVTPVRAAAGASEHVTPAIGAAEHGAGGAGHVPGGGRGSIGGGEPPGLRLQGPGVPPEHSRIPGTQLSSGHAPVEAPHPVAAESPRTSSPPPAVEAPRRSSRGEPPRYQVGEGQERQRSFEGRRNPRRPRPGEDGTGGPRIESTSRTDQRARHERNRGVVEDEEAAAAANAAEHATPGVAANAAEHAAPAVEHAAGGAEHVSSGHAPVDAPHAPASGPPRDPHQPVAALEEGEGTATRNNPNAMSPGGGGTTTIHPEVEGWVRRELERRGVPRPNREARRFMEWLQDGHRPSNRGGAHEHISPGSPDAERLLREWGAPEPGSAPRVDRSPETGSAHPDDPDFNQRMLPPPERQRRRNGRWD